MEAAIVADHAPEVARDGKFALDDRRSRFTLKNTDAGAFGLHRHGSGIRRHLLGRTAIQPEEGPSGRLGIAGWTGNHRRTRYHT